MSVPVFVDANILVYSVDQSQPAKQKIAADWLKTLWKNRCGHLSQQVLNEFYQCSTRKLRPGLDRDRAQSTIRLFAAWKPLPIDARLVERAFRVEGRFGFSFWDSLIVAAAQSVQARFLLTEDLQHGQNLDGPTVMNPFIDPPYSTYASEVHEPERT